MEDQEIAWDRSYKKGLFWKKETMGLKKIINKKSALELGVGNGKTLKAIIERNPKDVIALDISSEAIKKAKLIKSDKIKFATKDFLEFNTKKKFDVIICYYFLNNFKERQRKEVIEKITNLLKKEGIILFQDFAMADFRQNKSREIEKNTIQKQNGIICHFFEKNELKELFKDFKVEIEERTLFPIRKDRSIKRKIIKALIRTR